MIVAIVDVLVASYERLVVRMASTMQPIVHVYVSYPMSLRLHHVCIGPVCHRHVPYASMEK